MMTRTQRIRRKSYATRRAGARRRQTVEGSLRLRAAPAAQLESPAVRRLAPLVRPQPEHRTTRAPKRRLRRLKLVASNVRPRRSATVTAPPELRLIRGRAPWLLGAARPLPRGAPQPRPRSRSTASRSGQLVFVLAMAGIGLAALATSLGQILARVM